MNDPTELLATPKLQETAMAAAVDAVEHEMFAPHELPLCDELHRLYIETVKRGILAYLGALKT